MSTGTLRRIVVVPRNGYINRLQAWASAAALGASTGAPVQLCWEPEPIAPATPEQLFAPKTLTSSLMTPDELSALLGAPHVDLPRHLTRLPDRDVVVLAGHEVGEQAFMPRLKHLLDHSSAPFSLVVIAGGHFHLPGAVAPEEQRRTFYESLAWSEPIESGTRAALAGREQFTGVHVRRTDRSREAPTWRMLGAALDDLRQRTGVDSIFVASDSAEGQQRGDLLARKHGLKPWTIEHGAHDRSSSAAAVAAMVDWRVLGAARALVYTASSSFGHEATVLGDTVSASVALAAPPLIQRSRDARRIVTAALTYPQRRLRT